MALARRWRRAEQAVVLPISDKFVEAAHQANARLAALGIRATVDERNEKIGRKIRDAEMAKTPFMLILGEKEQAEGTLSVREHGVGDLGPQTAEAFAAAAVTEAARRSGITTPVAPAASAERQTAPRLRGS